MVVAGVELIGRRDEVAEITSRLAIRRLVTVIGPAGIGKTTVAKAVADRVGGAYELGTHVIDLTRVETADAVAAAIAAQLGFKSFSDLIESPSEQPALLLVDNCEHVTAAAAEAIGCLLAACRAPTVLATSRAPLDLPDESLVVIGPLSVPPPDSADVDNDSVQLFLERARDAGRPVAADQLPAVAALCRHLDGVPLAIELAAARTRTMQPAEILARLREGGVDVLARPRFRGDPRHRSLITTIDWSHRLLPPDAAAMLDRLALFVGPFTAAMVDDVGADLGLEPDASAEALQLLVDSSLVASEPSGEATTFRILETVRAASLRRLGEQGVLDEARERFVDHVVAETSAVVGSFDGRRWDPSNFNRLLSLYDNLVAAIRWCHAHDEEGHRALRLIAALWGIVYQAHTDEIAALCEATLERWPDSTDRHAPDAIATAATARYLVGDPAGALALAEQTLPRADSSPTAPVMLRRAIAYAANALGDDTTAERVFADVAALARSRGIDAIALEADTNRALLIAGRGDLPAAIELADKALAEATASASAINEVFARSVLGILQLRQDVAAALETVSSALDAARQIDYPAGIGANLRSLACGRLRNGKPRAAAETLLDLFDSLLARGRVAEIRGALYTTAELLHEVGSEAWAPLAASAEALPRGGPLGCAMDQLVRLPRHDAAPLSRRDAIALARDELRRFLHENDGPEPEAPPAQTSRTSASLVDRGEYCEITFAGRTISTKHSKGIADLRRLLSAPGQEIHCVELMGAAVEQPAAGPVLDDRARRDYERRVRELQAEIDEADAANDYARAERARMELDALVDQLAAAFGLGGRSRGQGSTAERARSAVTQRIRSTIRRLAAAHPALGRHLEASVTTGTFCVYRPEHPVEWKL